MNTMEVAEKLHVHRKLVIRWVRNVGLPCYKFGKEFRYRESEIDEWIERHKHQRGFFMRNVHT